MKFSIHPNIFTQFPDFKVGYLLVEGLNQDQHAPELHKIVQKAIDQALKKAEHISSDDKRMTSWYQVFSTLALDANKHKPAHIALFDRLKKDGKLPTILPIVDLTNSMSVTHLVPIGTHQLDNLSDDVVIRFTQEGDTFQGMNTENGEPIPTGELAYTSGSHVLTRHMVWRQGELSKIRLTSKSVLIPIDTFDNISEAQLLEIMKELQAKLVELFGVKVHTGILSKNSPTAVLSQMKVSKEQSKLLEVLGRGVAEVLPSVNSLADLMTKKKIRVFLGIDPTGSLLTLGHSVVLKKLQQFADLGHDVILLIGNGTVRIGDPTGRDSTRPVLTDEQIEENFKSWKEQASKILDFDKIRITHNGDWLDKLSYADLIKLMAQTTVQQLIERDMFQDRIKKNLPIFGHEIMYPLMQGYDSVAMDVDLEIGGTDQTFNMMMGRHLQRVYNNREKWVLSTPIINGTDGRKMSKSYGNFIALTEQPNDMYGKLMSIDDSMIIEYFTVLTDEPMHSIEKMKIALEQGQHPLPFKKRLAFVITAFYHTQAEAIQAEKHFEATVQRKQIPDQMPQISFKDQSIAIIDILQKAAPEMTKSQLRRLVDQGGVEVILKTREKIKPTDYHEKFGVLNVDVVRIGKRKFVKVVKG